MTHVLSEATEDGHCYLPQSELSENVIKLLTTQEHQPTEDAIAGIELQAIYSFTLSN